MIDEATSTKAKGFCHSLNSVVCISFMRVNNGLDAVGPGLKQISDQMLLARLAPADQSQDKVNNFSPKPRPADPSL